VKKLLIPIVIAIVVGGGVGGYFLFAKKPHAEAKEVKQEGHGKTVELEEFVVNLSDKIRPHYLKVTIALEAPGEADIEKLKEATPYIRDVALMILTKRKYEDLLTEEGKCALKQELLTRIQEVAEKRGTKVSSILFTSFVMD
jgi:flagellar FliL protein